MATEQKTTPGVLDTVLCAIDGAECSMAAVEYAVRLGREIGSRILVVYVVDIGTIEYLSQMRILVAEERTEFERDLEATGKKYLLYVNTMAQKHNIHVETSLHKGVFHTVILDLMRNLKPSAILMGICPLSATRRDATNTERHLVFSEACCPVILVKSETRA